MSERKGCVSVLFGKAYPETSEDEIHPELRFTGAGILAMANSGPNTNGALVFCSAPSRMAQLQF